MKLQGKKTGTVANFIGYIDQATPTIDLPTGNTMLTVRYMDAGVNCYKDYMTIKEFNEDWEDYKPAEPLIDDKDIRNRLRKWMEAIDISLDTHLTRVQSGDYGLIIESGDNRIAFCYYKKLLHRRKTGLVTMRELIGEEE
jgi:hypothetical protein